MQSVESLKDFAHTTGNVYWVKASTATEYSDFLEEYNVEYMDGTSAVKTDIQTGLDACTDNMDDYVYITPDDTDYSITATLTMSKRGVHLLGLGGARKGGIPSIGVKVAQGTASTACVTTSAHDVEIGGIFFVGKADSSIIVVSGAMWHTYVHDNFLGMATTSGSASIGAFYATSGLVHTTISGNYITNYGPAVATQTIGYFIRIEAGTRNMVIDNILVTGGSTTVTKGIYVGGDGALVLRNYLRETVVWGGLAAGTFTHGIGTNVDAMVADNKISMTDDNEVTGGTANETYVENYEGTSGGVVIV